MTTLYDRYIRHQVYLEGFKAGAAMSFVPFSQHIEDAIRREFSVLKVEDFGQLTKARIHQLISVIKGKIDGPMKKYAKAILAFLRKFMLVEIGIFVEAMEGADKPDADTLWTAILNSALPSNGQFVEVMFKALGAAVVQKVTDTIYKAAANATTVAEALAALVGDPTSLFGGAVLHRVDKQNTILLDTVIQHISQTASAKVGASVFDIFTWVSVIDKGTTDVCLDRNGQVFNYSDGPIPPAHYGCRANAIPGDVEPVASFALWLKDEPDDIRADMGSVTNPRPLSLEAFAAKIDFIMA